MELKNESMDPDDVIYGQVKLDGSRSYGYGTDVLRLWSAKNDGDINFNVTLE